MVVVRTKQSGRSNMEHTFQELEELIASVRPLDEAAMAQAEKRQAYRVKVPGSLGRLEDISIRIAGITGKPYGNEAAKQAIILMCADNGVVAEGVASAPQTVTLMQTQNFTRRITGVGSQAKYFGIDILDIDIGVRLPIQPELSVNDMLTSDGRLAEGVVDRRIADGTGNLAKEPAMTKKQALAALFVGIEAAKACKTAGMDIIGVGEMGIGNSTTGACMICAFTGADAADVVGRGGGLNDEGLARKTEVVNAAVAKYNCDDPIEVARRMGGFDILGMAGAYIGAAVYRIPVVADGFISVAAALLASEIAPQVKDFLFTSHKSQESGYSLAVGKLGIPPMFDLGMKLGEGSGCPIAFKIVEASLAAMNLMKSLEEGSIDAEYLEELRKNNDF